MAEATDQKLCVPERATDLPPISARKARRVLIVVRVLLVLLVLLTANSFSPEFVPDVVFANAKGLLQGKPLPPAVEGMTFAAFLKELGVRPPLLVSLPPQYAEEIRGNGGVMQSLAATRGVTFGNSVFPHPALRITSAPAGTTPAYHSDSRPFNAAFVFEHEGDRWPIGFTSFVDFVHVQMTVRVITPSLITEDGRKILPVRAHSPSRFNRVELTPEATRLYSKQWAPVIWEFPEAGRLPPELAGKIALDETGKIASLILALPSGKNVPMGLMMLQEGHLPDNWVGPLPSWWEADRRLRKAILEGAPFSILRPLILKIRAEYPGHPLLNHYVVVSRIHSPELTDIWLEWQHSRCDLTTWQLLPWTKATWEQVRVLPCLAQEYPHVNSRFEHVFGTLLLHFRGQRTERLKEIAQMLLTRTFHKSEGTRSFAYPITDVAALWLDESP